MDITQQITFYETASTLCLVVMLAAFALAAFLFIRFRIPKTVSLLTGRARDRSVEKMKQSGVLRNRKEVEEERAESARLRAAETGTEEYSTENISPKATVLKEEDPLTTVLAEGDETLTIMLSADEKPEEASGATQKLGTKDRDFAAEKPPELDIEFRILEHSVVVHTDEFI